MQWHAPFCFQKALGQALNQRFRKTEVFANEANKTLLSLTKNLLSLTLPLFLMIRTGVVLRVWEDYLKNKAYFLNPYVHTPVDSKDIEFQRFIADQDQFFASGLHLRWFSDPDADGVPAIYNGFDVDNNGMACGYERSMGGDGLGAAPSPLRRPLSLVIADSLRKLPASQKYLPPRDLFILTYNHGTSRLTRFYNRKHLPAKVQNIFRVAEKFDPG